MYKITEGCIAYLCPTSPVGLRDAILSWLLQLNNFKIKKVSLKLLLTEQDQKSLDAVEGKTHRTCIAYKTKYSRRLDL